MRISKESEVLIVQNINLLTILRSNNRNNAAIIALLLCEIFYTNPTRRLLEYFVWLIVPINKKRKREISIGIGQIKIKHWERFGFIRSGIRLSSLWKVTNVLYNYDLMEKILFESKVDLTCSSKVIATYRGETRAHHLSLFTCIKQMLDNYHTVKLSRQPSSRKSYRPTPLLY